MTTDSALPRSLPDGCAGRAGCCSVSTLAAILIGIFGIVAALLQSRLDGLRVRFDNSITAVIAADEQADSMVDMVASTWSGTPGWSSSPRSPMLSAAAGSGTPGTHIVVMDPEARCPAVGADLAQGHTGLPTVARSGRQPEAPAVGQPLSARRLRTAACR